MHFENENWKVENAESVCKIQQIIFAAFFIRPAIHHVQFFQFAVISDRHMAKLSKSSGLWGKKSTTYALYVASFENENWKDENAESVCKIQQIIFCSSVHHVFLNLH